MAFDKAEITLSGRLGKNPEIFNGGCSVSVGKNHKTNKQGVNSGEVTDWFTVKFFNRGNYSLGDWASQQLRKGMWLLSLSPPKGLINLFRKLLFTLQNSTF